MLNNQKTIRKIYWESYPQNKNNELTALSDFVEFVNYLHDEKIIDEKLAKTVTLMPKKRKK